MFWAACEAYQALKMLDTFRVTGGWEAPAKVNEASETLAVVSYPSISTVKVCAAWAVTRADVMTGGREGTAAVAVSDGERNDSARKKYGFGHVAAEPQAELLAYC